MPFCGTQSPPKLPPPQEGLKGAMAISCESLSPVKVAPKLQLLSFLMCTEYNDRWELSTSPTLPMANSSWPAGGAVTESRSAGNKLSSKLGELFGYWWQICSAVLSPAKSFLLW